MHGKIHRANVTEANLEYMGSITIDADLLDAAGILPGERVQICNNNNGARLETYTIASFAKDMIFAIDHDDFRDKASGFFFIHAGISDDDDYIADGSHACRSTVQADDAASSFSGNG